VESVCWALGDWADDSVLLLVLDRVETAECAVASLPVVEDLKYSKIAFARSILVLLRCLFTSSVWTLP
jgi:hypothetical protein